jgi:hypothetical protein
MKNPLEVFVKLPDENHLVWICIHVLEDALVPVLRLKFERDGGQIPMELLSRDGKTFDITRAITHVISKNPPFLTTLADADEFAREAMVVRSARNSISHSGKLDRQQAINSILSMKKLCEAVKDFRCARTLGELARVAVDKALKIKIESNGSTQKVSVGSSKPVLFPSPSRRWNGRPIIKQSSRSLPTAGEGSENVDDYQEDEAWLEHLEQERGTDFYDDDQVRVHVLRIENRALDKKMVRAYGKFDFCYGFPDY